MPDESRWDARYAADPDAARRAPSPAVTAALAGLPPGRAVDVAAGAGRHALWLAGRGWSVTAVDVSATGLELGRSAALERALDVRWVVADVLSWRPDTPVDLVLTAYVQLGVAGLRRVASWLAPGGRLVVVGHAAAARTAGSAAPDSRRCRNPAYLHTPEQLRDGANALVVERLEQVRGPDAVELVLVARAGDARVPEVEQSGP